MKKQGLFLFFFLSGIFTFGQVQITGIVTDSLSRKPIADVNILVKGAKLGTATDSSGCFSLTINALPERLIVSEIRHHTSEFRVTESKLNLKLAPKVQMLEGVSIQEERIQNIHPDKKFYAYDFEFYEDFILVLAFEKTKKKSQLLVLEDDGKVILSKKLADRPEGFFRDFMGNVHLLTVDSAFQIYYDYENIHLLYSLQKLDFMATMYQCKAEHNNCILINKGQYRGLESLFFSVGEGEKRLFYTVADSAKRSYLEREFDLKYFINLRNNGVEEFMVSVKTLRENLDFYRQMVGTDWMDSKILAPVFAPLYKIDDTVHVFDYTHSEVVQFDPALNVKRKTPIAFHQDRRWTKQIIIDDTWQDIYTCYTRDGITHITKLDKTDFKPVKVSEVNGLIYIDKLKIRNGHAYFLHKDLIRNYNSMIYRMVL